MSGASARQVAYDALKRIDSQGAYANLVLPSMLARSGLGDRDRRFVTELVYGTTRMRRACDALVDRFIVEPPDAATRSLLRLGAYQIEFTEVPAHAAVAETVGLAPRRVRGFVNAVLRKVVANPMVWPSDATRFSYPDWIVDRMNAELGEDDARYALATMNLPPAVTRRDDGYVQDQSSQWVAAAVDAEPGELVADVCAAPGGKATWMERRGANVVACDISESRMGLVASNRDSLDGLLSLLVADATAPALRSDAFDAVLVDAPCSGLGALRRRPDARWRIMPGDLDDLVRLQALILAASAMLVQPGGKLVYSVCTLTAAESIDHVTPRGFEVDTTPPTVGEWRPYGQGWRVLPQDADTDGMTLIRYRRRDDG